jgi:hypothetical protein
MAIEASKTRDWSQYNAAAKKSGAISFYISQEAITAWYNEDLTGERGASETYSDIAVEACLTLRAAYGLSLRKANGFIQSIFDLMKLQIECPDYTTLCRRARYIKPIFARPASKEPIVIAIDSTGIKIYGEGEWKVRQHGVSKRRTWLKLHMAVNVHNHHIESFEVTANNVADSEVAPRLLKSIRSKVRACQGDGAYDVEAVYQVAEDIGASLIVPSRRDARLQDPANAITAKAPRDAAIIYIHQHGADEEARKHWKRASGYHARSLSETAMYRFKTHCCSFVRSRTLENQCAEIAIKVKIVNKIAALGTFPLNRSEVLGR